jgi:hypothetical protein
MADSRSGGTRIHCRSPSAENCGSPLNLILIAALLLQASDEVRPFLRKRPEPRHIVLMSGSDPQGLRSIL